MKQRSSLTVQTVLGQAKLQRIVLPRTKHPHQSAHFWYTGVFVFESREVVWYYSLEVAYLV